MNAKLVEDIAAAVLYEGYLLYPYRPSAIKNRQRFNFGVIYPRAYANEQAGADTWRMRMECLVRASGEAILTVRVRFLRLVDQKAEECDLTLPSNSLSRLTTGASIETFTYLAREHHGQIDLMVETSAKPKADGLFTIQIAVSNLSALRGDSRDEVLLDSLISTHAILQIEGAGEFISLLDPPAEFRAAAEECRNSGWWPVLAGNPGDHDCMLCSPIILYDYPEIGPESPGALFDGTEIDEILTLRIMTLSDDEKREMVSADERTREILERTEQMPPEQFLKLHGVLRGLRPVNRETQ